MTTYDTIYKLCEQKGIAVTTLESTLGFGRGSIGKLKNGGDITATRLKKIAWYFGVTVDYLINGEESSANEPQLTAKDKKDIAKDLESIMEKLNSQEEGPASFDGQDIPEDDRELFAAQLEAMLIRLKKINKELYNPTKNKK